MANVLAELFGDIADAIREKTGSTDKMSPAAFPEKISGIEGGGGGSLPAGIYFTPSALNHIGSYGQLFFELDGVIYAITSDNSSNGLATFRKFQNNAWTTVVSSFDTGLGTIGISHRVLVYHGKAHIMGYGMNAHVIFDGTTAVKGSTLPAYCAGIDLCIHDDKLMFNRKGVFYAWDEDTDTWSAVATLTSFKTAEGLYMFSINGDLRFISGSTLYKFTNLASAEYVAEHSLAVSVVGAFAIGTRIFYYRTTRIDDKLYCYDVLTGEEKTIGNTPRFAFAFSLFGGKPHATFIENKKTVGHMEIHIVEADE